MPSIEVSLVVPVYSGARTLGALARELARIRTEWAVELPGLHLAEVLFVDDGSIDDSATVLREIADEYEWTRVITLSRNFGQHPATMAGILQTSGDWVVTLDEDLQHPPAAIVAMLERAALTASDVIYAKPRGAVHGTLHRDASSQLIKRLVSWLSGIPHVRDFNSFRVLRGSIARAAAAVSSHETYYDVALCWFTESIGTCPVTLTDQRVQTGHRSGYSMRRLLSHARRLLISSQTRLLRAGALIGLGAMASGGLLGLYKLIQRQLDPSYTAVPGWLSLFLAVLFFGGMSALLTGILLEYMRSMLLHTQGKPTFFAVDRSRDGVLASLLRARKEMPANAAVTT